MTSDDAKMRAMVEAGLRRAGADRSPLARWVRINRTWLERVLLESGAGWLAVAEALVEAGAVPVPEGWSSGVAAERRQARRRLADAVRQAWKREVVRRPGPPARSPGGATAGCAAQRVPDGRPLPTGTPRTGADCKNSEDRPRAPVTGSRCRRRRVPPNAAVPVGARDRL